MRPWAESCFCVIAVNGRDQNPCELIWNVLLQADRCFPSVHEVRQVKGKQDERKSFTELSHILRLLFFFYYEDVT